MDAEGNCSLEVPDQSVQHILEQVHHRDKMIPVDVKNTHSFTFPHRFQLFSETNASPLTQLKSQWLNIFKRQFLQFFNYVNPSLFQT